VDEGLAFLESHVYLVALLGLAVFYGLERLATSSRRRKREVCKEDSTSEGVFCLHVSSFAVYNFLIGYLLLHQLTMSLQEFLLFFLAMALHFVVKDHGLREHHKSTYLRSGRWMLAFAALLG
jgi:hypothetical protein